MAITIYLSANFAPSRKVLQMLQSQVLLSIS